SGGTTRNRRRRALTGAVRRSTVTLSLSPMPITISSRSRTRAPVALALFLTLGAAGASAQSTPHPNRPFGTLREQAARQQAWLKERLDSILPRLTRNYGTALGVVPMRHHNQH